MFGKFFGGGGNPISVFSRLAKADERLQAAKGRIVAANDSLQAKRDELARLNEATQQVHNDHDDLDNALDTLEALI